MSTPCAPLLGLGLETAVTSEVGGAEETGEIGGEDRELLIVGGDREVSTVREEQEISNGDVGEGSVVMVAGLIETCGRICFGIGGSTPGFRAIV
jgi:hypothetical protein